MKARTFDIDRKTETKYTPLQNLQSKPGLGFVSTFVLKLQVSICFVKFVLARKSLNLERHQIIWLRFRREDIVRAKLARCTVKIINVFCYKWPSLSF